ncbi:MAG TPA: hypothetical protein H9818_04050 [Candidatus Phocaeicola gallistercoris]|nr:hypothetical protein [Candidatus Phocaeicola gallistercoris]
MTVRLVRFSFVLLVVGVCVNCSVVPLTGRKQVLLVSDSDVLTFSLTQ